MIRIGTIVKCVNFPDSIYYVEEDMTNYEFTKNVHHKKYFIVNVDGMFVQNYRHLQYLVDLYEDAETIRLTRNKKLERILK